MIDKNEILKLRYAIVKAVRGMDVNIAEEVDKAKNRFNKEELRLYIENEGSFINSQIKIIENLLTLTNKEVKDIDLAPVIETEAILNKYKYIKEILKKELN